MWVKNAHSCVYENMALPEHPGQGGLDVGGNHFIITHSDKNVSARQASTVQTLCAQVSPAQRGSPCSEQGQSCNNCWFQQHSWGSLGFKNIIHFWDSVLLELSTQCCYFMRYRRKLTPPLSPGKHSLQSRSSFTASAPSGGVYCHVQVLIYIFIPLKQWKWLNKP